MQHNCAVGKHGFFRKVRYVNHRDFIFFIEFLHHRRYLAPPARIEHRRGFVQNNNPRLQRKNAGYGYALFLPARKLRCFRMAEFFHSHRAQREIDSPPDFFPRHARVFGAERNVVLHHARHRLVIGVLKHHARVFSDFEQIFPVGGIHAEHENFPRGRRQQTVDQARQRRFSAAVMPQNRHELALSDFQRYVFQRISFAVAVRERNVLQFYRGRSAILFLEKRFARAVFRRADVFGCAISSAQFFTSFSLSAARKAGTLIPPTFRRSYQFSYQLRNIITNNYEKYNDFHKKHNKKSMKNQ